VPKSQTVRQPFWAIRLVQETVGELRKVSWPTWQEAVRLTGIVMVVLFFASLFLGTIDFLLTEVFRLLLTS
jgi:preprotein translocase subunit SecE